MQKDAPQLVRTTVNLDLKTHRAFRTELARQGKTASDVLREAIVSFIGKAK